MMRQAIVALVAVLGVQQACVRRQPAPATVSLDAVQPDSVFVSPGAVVQVVLRGHGFVPGAPGQNVVMFGSYAINAVPSNADGTEIRLVIPETLPSGGEAPPQPVAAGPYPIRVRSAAAESNAVIVRIVR